MTKYRIVKNGLDEYIIQYNTGLSWFGRLWLGCQEWISYASTYITEADAIRYLDIIKEDAIKSEKRKIETVIKEIEI